MSNNLVCLAKKTKLFSLNNSIAPVGRMELAEKVFQVGSDSFLGNTESVGDLLVAQALFQQ